MQTCYSEELSVNVNEWLGLPPHVNSISICLTLCEDDDYEEEEQDKGASRYDVCIGGGHGKADAVKEVVEISLYKSEPNVNKVGRGWKYPKILRSSYMEAP